jgi:hypothetical protein
MATRQCPFCGKEVFERATQCPYCREGLAAVRVAADSPAVPGSGEIRRGLLAVLLSAVLGYFAGGYSAMPLPFPIKPFVVVYLSPLLFLSGIALSLRGFYIQHKASSHTTHSSRA